MAETIISVKNLVKNYGNFKAVKDISFNVYEGEIFGLLGPNGAGKSTTLEIMETLRKKTSGEVVIAGLNLDKQPDEIKKIILANDSSPASVKALVERMEQGGDHIMKTRQGRMWVAFGVKFTL